MADEDTEPSYRIRVTFARGMMGPGKAELLERIAETGSIAAAGHAMGMSYKRAWQLVETINTCSGRRWSRAIAAARGAATRS